MISTMITITKFNGMNYAQWATEMALHLMQKYVYRIMKGYDDKPEEPAGNVTTTEMATFKDWMDRQGVTGLTILLGTEQRIQADHTVFNDRKTLWENPESAYESMLKLNIFEIKEELWSIKLQDCGDIDTYTLHTNRENNDFNPCAERTATSTASTNAADTDIDTNAMTITKMGEQEHILYIPRGIRQNDIWKVFFELMMDTNATMTAWLDEIVAKLIDKEAATMGEQGLAPEALLFPKNGGKGGKGGKGPKKDKGENNRQEKDQRECFHCQRRWRIAEKCLSKRRGNPPKAANTAGKVSTETTSTLTTSIENYWMVASSYSPSSYFLIDCGCMTQNSGRPSMFITYTEYPPNTEDGEGIQWGHVVCILIWKC